MRLTVVGSNRRDDLDDASFRELYHAARAEAESLRLSLFEIEHLQNVVEAELRSVTMLVQTGEKNHEVPDSALPSIIRARTLTRLALHERLAKVKDRDRVFRDLRFAEVSFSFLIGVAGSEP